MENKNNRILLTVIGAATLLVALVGATFAYFSATSTTETKTVTTASSQIKISADHNAVENIKPTTFDRSAADAGTNTDIVRIKLTVTGTTNTENAYTITMNEPAITLPGIENKTGGTVADIKYSVFKGTDASADPIVDAASFKGTVSETVIVPSTDYDADFVQEYYVYIWIDNKNEAQDSLQNVSFKLTFDADTITKY